MRVHLLSYNMHSVRTNGILYKAENTELPSCG